MRPHYKCAKGNWDGIPDSEICNTCPHLRMTRSMRFTCDYTPEEVQEDDRDSKGDAHE